jgi:hypothetical protein
MIDEEELKSNEDLFYERVYPAQNVISDDEKVSFEEVMELEDALSNLGPDFHNGLPTTDGLLPKTKLVKKKRSKLAQDETSSKSYDAYFKYLPFEKAVIESKGKAPYSNRDVE